MNTKIIALVVAVIVIAGGVYWFMPKTQTGVTPNDKSAMNSEVKDSKSNSEPATKASSLKDLLALGTSQKCTFSNEGSEGTFYVSKGQSRGDFSSNAGGTTTKGHMISDGKTSYVWMDSQPKGFKMSLEAAQKAQAESNYKAPAPSAGIDYNKNMNYSCQSWSADDSMFAVPTNIEFTDMAAMMEQTKMMQDQVNKMKR